MGGWKLIFQRALMIVLLTFSKGKHANGTNSFIQLIPTITNYIILLSLYGIMKEIPVRKEWCLAVQSLEITTSQSVHKQQGLAFAAMLIFTSTESIRRSNKR